MTIRESKPIAQLIQARCINPLWAAVEISALVQRDELSLFQSLGHLDQVCGEPTGRDLSALEAPRSDDVADFAVMIGAHRLGGDRQDIATAPGLHFDLR